MSSRYCSVLLTEAYWKPIAFYISTELGTPKREKLHIFVLFTVLKDLVLSSWGISELC